LRGYGEAAPVDRYDESPESALAYIEEHGDALGDDPFALEEIMERLPHREFAAASGIRLALHDLQGKLLGRPCTTCSAYAGPGRRRRGRSGSATPTTWARRAGKVDPRFKRLKLKLGGRDGLDVERYAQSAARRCCRCRST